MATKEDEKEKSADESDQPDEAGEDEAPASSEDSEPEADEKALSKVEKEDAVAKGDVATPGQLGFRRFVYGAYFAGAILIAFVASKILSFGWTKLAAWKPGFGEPREELVMSASAVIGAVAAFYYWRRTRARTLAEQVAEELSKVTWPSRKEVTNGTTVVIVTTVLATVFFFLMDRFWGFVTDKVYGM